MAEKTMMLGEVKEYNEMLKRAHQMLVDIDIPVAPLNTMIIRVDENARHKNIAQCLETSDGFLILLHKYNLNVQAVDGEKSVIFTSILHELLHTCIGDEYDNYGLFDHGKRFVDFANRIKDAYQYNVMTSVDKADLAFAHLEPVHITTCPHCGSQTLYYTKKTWEPMKKLIKEGRQIRCGYCKTVINNP